MQPAELDARYLPGVLQEIAELIGLPATLKLVESYGGVRLYVPKRIDDDHALARLIGLDNARLLSDAYGAEEHFDIPRAVAATRAVRDMQIRTDRKTMTHRELALKYGLTERQIRNILQEEDDDRQVGLF